MDQFVIEGGFPLSGTMTPAGNKNVAVALLAACALTSHPVTLRRVPNIGDVATMREIMEKLGTRVEELAPDTWRLHTPQLDAAQMDIELGRRIRASMLMAGPMLARHG